MCESVKVEYVAFCAFGFAALTNQGFAGLKWGGEDVCEETGSPKRVEHPLGRPIK